MNPDTPFTPTARNRDRTTIRIVDAVAGGTLWLLLAAGAIVAVFFSFFFAMAADGCYSEAQCPHENLILVGMVIVWVSVGLAGVAALVGTVVSLTGDRLFWYWPALGCAMVVVAFFVGAHLASTGGGLS